MTLEIWLPEGIHEEHEITVTNQFKEISFYPYKMFHLDLLNTGDDDAKIMVNNQSLPKAITLSKNERRDFEAKYPKYERIVIYSTGTATVRITATR